MKFLFVLAFVAVVAARPEEDDYSRYENFDVDEVFTNDRLYKGYFQCIDETGKCTAEGNDLKVAIPKVIQNNCSNCSEKLKFLIAKVITLIQEKHPEDWETINKKYNPDGAHDEYLKAFLDKYKS